MSNNAKDLKQLMKAAKLRGWCVELTNGGHFRWTLPGRGFFFSAQTPGDYRVIKKIKNDMQKVEEGRILCLTR